MEFLYSLNRLNVATSRAQCVAIVVASPDLVRVTCHTPRQMQLANALCRFVEYAEGRGPAGAGARRAASRPPIASASPTETGTHAGAGPTKGDQLSWLG